MQEIQMLLALLPENTDGKTLIPKEFYSKVMAESENMSEAEFDAKLQEKFGVTTDKAHKLVTSFIDAVVFVAKK